MKKRIIQVCVTTFNIPKNDNELHLHKYTQDGKKLKKILTRYCCSTDWYTDEDK